MAGPAAAEATRTTNSLDCHHERGLLVSTPVPVRGIEYCIKTPLAGWLSAPSYLFGLRDVRMTIIVAETAHKSIALTIDRYSGSHSSSLWTGQNMIYASLLIPSWLIVWRESS